MTSDIKLDPEFISNINSLEETITELSGNNSDLITDGSGLVSDLSAYTTKAPAMEEYRLLIKDIETLFFDVRLLLAEDQGCLKTIYNNYVNMDNEANNQLKNL